MTYGEYISVLRRQVGDTVRRMHVEWIGDGSTTVFQMPADTFPVYDDATTYVVKVNGSTQTETTHYTLDKEAGTLVLLSAPTNGHVVMIDSGAVHLTNAGWLQVINDVIRSLGDDFFKEFTDDSTFSSTAAMTELSLVSNIPTCIAVYDFWYRESASSDWDVVESIGNWRHDRENNIIHIGSRETFPRVMSLKIRGLKTYVLGDDVDDTIDVQDRFMTIIEYGSLARYYRYRYKSVIELVSKMTQESTRTPLQELIMLSDRFDRSYEIEKAKLKPQKPPRVIPNFQHGAGRP